MKAGYRTARYCDEQERKQALTAHKESGKRRQIDCRLRYEHADDCRDYHCHQQIAVQVIARLQQRPNRRDRGDEHVYKHNYVPIALRHVHWQPQPQHYRAHQQYKCDCGIEPFVELAKVQQHAQADRFEYEYHGSSRDRTVCGDSAHRAIGRRCEAVERAGYDVGKCRHHQYAEQPAEHQKQFFAGAAYVFLYYVTYCAALVFDRRVHGRKVLHRPKEHAAHQYPQQYRHPAEYRGLYRTGYRPCAGYRCKLMPEYDIGIGGHVVDAVFEFVCGRFGLGIDAPGPGQIPAVYQVCGQQYHDCNCHHDKTIHNLNLLCVYM